MSGTVPSGHDHRSHRLLLGLEPVDAVRGSRLSHPVSISLEGLQGRLRLISRHASGRFTLLADPSLGTPLDLLIGDPRRRWVPRRLSVPLPPAARLLRPSLYPGAAYDVAETATGLRGRVVRGGSPVPWVRVEARLEGTSPVVGRAHGDDRGEFLLLLDRTASPLPELSDPVRVEISVFAAAGTLEQPPLEELPDPDTELVETALGRPPGYTSTVTRVVELRLAYLLTGTEVTDFVLA